MFRKNTLPELLAPAGDMDCLYAAVSGGADAVYVGGKRFGARAFAKNFDIEGLSAAVRYCHLHGVKLYVTLNTLIEDKEMAEAIEYAAELYRIGVDALIVADVGVISAIRRLIPMLEIHASTQMSVHNSLGARVCADMGITRVVPARELSLTDIKSIVENSPCEVEVFLHGALCVCHSGQCLFSSLVGGRSGNRGECAQPCRLPYNGKYPLSLADLSLAGHITELIDSGVASLKIEGRMKSPEYVRDVARIFRRLMDEHRGADDEEMAELAAVFSRDGLTDGYYQKKISSAMLGRRTEADKQSSRALDPFQRITRKIPLHLSVSIKAGESAVFSVWNESGSLSRQTSEIPQAAKTAPLTKESVIKSFSKLGNTPYEVADIAVTLDEGLMLPVSVMNGLRRETILAFGEATAPSSRSASDFMKQPILAPKKRNREENTAVCYQPQEIPKEAREFFDIIYLPVDRYDGSTEGVLLPPVIFDGEREKIEELLHRAKEMGAKHALIGNLGHLSMVTKQGLIPHGDFRLNATNQKTVAVLEELDFADVILSPELTLPQLRDIGGTAKVIVYGRIPLMVTEKCVGKELGGCERCQEGKLKLTDRRGVSFPVLKEWQHRSLILNSVPLYMADRMGELNRNSLRNRHFLFTVESKREIQQIIDAYQKGLPPKGDVRRIR